jgi:23S rRNA C2498 (ribose-2'-O)-methylase RlmM
MNNTGQKFGGRTKGTKNLKTSETKEIIQSIVRNQMEDVEELLNKLEPNDRINAIIKLISFVVPKQSTIEIDNKEEEEGKFSPLTITLIDPYYGEA